VLFMVGLCAAKLDAWFIQTPHGMTGEYRLRPSKSGLRLEARCASLDLRMMVVEEGWRIQAVKTARDAEAVAVGRVRSDKRGVQAAADSRVTQRKLDRYPVKGSVSVRLSALGVGATSQRRSSARRQWFAVG
jgi:hypothetical protein